MRCRSWNSASRRSDSAATISVEKTDSGVSCGIWNGAGSYGLPSNLARRCRATARSMASAACCLRSDWRAASSDLSRSRERRMRRSYLPRRSKALSRVSQLRVGPGTVTPGSGSGGVIEGENAFLNGLGALKTPDPGGDLIDQTGFDGADGFVVIADGGVVFEEARGFVFSKDIDLTGQAEAEGVEASTRFAGRFGLRCLWRHGRKLLSKMKKPAGETAGSPDSISNMRAERPRRQIAVSD